ncbi:MAG TPA: chemotaxis protein CheA [Proteobacteria bacterium]|nr:chemotaxis protein CheA [bacterium BMS3Abin14]HDL54321.1 chemotaxis protein CheA [Pseudomonadota bacterium]
MERCSKRLFTGLSIVDQSLKDFVSEAEDILEDLESFISQLMEITPEDHRKPDIINAIFRDAHSLKGLSGMLNLDNLSALSHRIESLLDDMRLDKIALSDDVVDVLSQGVQLIIRMVHAIASGHGDDSVDVGEFMKNINGIGQTSQDTGAGDLSDFIDVPAGMADMLSEYEEHRFRDNILKGNPFFRIQCRFPLASFDTRLRELGSSIRDIGELITTLPQTNGGVEGTIGFLLYFTTKEPIQNISTELEGEGTILAPVPFKDGLPSFVSAVPPSKSTGSPVEDVLVDEIRGVSNTVRVDIAKLDHLMNLVGELVILRSNFSNIAHRIRQQGGMDGAGVIKDIEKSNVQMEKRLIDLRDSVMDIRMVPMEQLFNRLQRVSKKIARELKKEVKIEFAGGDTELDKMIMEQMVSPLLHIVRNCLDHGIEKADERIAEGKKKVALVRLSAYQQGSHVVLEVEDDGRGIDLAAVRKSAVERGLLGQNDLYSDEDVMSVLFKPGFSTKRNVTEISGRGVGLDVVRKELENVGGTAEINTVRGMGTRVTLTLPITLAILQALLIRSGRKIFAIPMGSIQETIRVEKKDIKTVQGREMINLRDRTLPLVRLERVFGVPATVENDETFAVIVGMANRTMGLVANELLGKQDVVIKPLGDAFSSVVGLAGAAELGDQTTVLVLDVAGLMMEAIRLGSAEGRG